MTTTVAHSPDAVHFGTVRPGSAGPDISVDPSFGPPALSFNGGVQIKKVPVDATVRARVVGDSSTFGVRDTIALEWTLEEVDPGELPPGHHGPPPKVRVLEVVASSSSGAPLAVTAGQFLLVRVFYATGSAANAILSATLIIEADSWDTIQVPLSLEIASVQATFTAPPLKIARGGDASTPVLLESRASRFVSVTFVISNTQLHSGLSIAANSSVLDAGRSLSTRLTFHADPGAPLGDNTLALDQWDFYRTGLMLPVTVFDAPTPAPTVDPGVRWEQAGSAALAIDPDQGIWHAGHVNALLATGEGGLLAGTDSGGVWAIASNGVALAHSNDWNDPNITCLARGPDDANHFYAGAAVFGSLYVSDPSSVFLNYIKWVEVPLSDGAGARLDTGAVLCMAVATGRRKLVLGCAKGVYVADIPALGQAHVFAKVPLLPDLAYAGIALGPDESVVVASIGDGTALSGLFVGSWQASGLLFQRSNIDGGFDNAMMRRASLASCDSRRTAMMAVIAAPDGWMMAVLRSEDGGQNWRRLKTSAPSKVDGRGVPLESRPPDDPAGGQGDYNNCIAVSPLDPSLVVIGWRNGPWFSSDGGLTWRLPKSNETDRHLHEDLHGLAFHPDGQTLYVGCDGGIVVTHDLGGSYLNDYNPRLSNLQFEGPGREFYGVFSASRRLPGLIAGGLQDNGNVYAALEAPDDAFRQLENSDGQVMLFIETGHVLHYNSNEVDKITAHRWDGNGFVDGGTVGVSSRGPGPIEVAGGLPRSAVAMVAQPLFRNPDGGQRLFAMACPFGGNDLYGLFADDDGGHMQWCYIGTLPVDPSKSSVWALASLHGDTVYAGTSDGRIFSVSPRSRLVIEFDVPIRTVEPGAIWHLCVLRDGVAFASYTTANDGGRILQSNFLTWELLGSSANVARGQGLPTDAGPIYGFDIDRGGETHTLFACTDTAAYDSHDEGETWLLANTGLPRRPHCTELRAVAHDDGRRYVYLSTFGRSVWRARLA